ncbi:MAG: DUF192 domain-containing protein [Candidatus Pacebacteria bacterium]|nr:DUF192 domain-containing protein [Candidatus Paceibacterota bacterium]
MRYKIAGTIVVSIAMILFVGICTEYYVSDEIQELDLSAQANLSDPDRINSNFSFNESVQIGESVFEVEIADIKDKRILGLSGRVFLLPTQGMLFIFEEPGIYTFWMKDMNFSIDILWIDEEKRIVHIIESLAPETFPEKYISKNDALYVLELSEGVVRDLGIKIGDEVVFDI